MADDEGFKLDDLAETIFKQRYARDEDETWEEASRRVARFAASAEDNGKVKRFEEEFYNEIVNNRFMPGGRIWYGAGRKVAQSLNCFVVPIADSREGWGQMLYDTTVISGTGGGIGVNYSDVRPRGAPIAGTGGVATGAVSAMKMQNAIAEELRQGGGRRAALMQCLDLTHPDLPEFLEVKLDRHELNNANISVVLDMPAEDFRKLVEEDGEIEFAFNGLKTGDSIRAREVWEKIVQNSWESGEPGVLNGHLANKMNNISYYEKLVSTNPCFPGSELLLTETGYHSMYDLYVAGNELLIATDNRISYKDELPNEDSQNWKFDLAQVGTTDRKSSNVFKTREDAEIVLVETKAGYRVRATPNHRIATRNGMVEAKNLTEDDEILIALPEPKDGIVGDLPKTDEEIAAMLCGLIAGDGTFGNNQVKAEFWGGDRDRIAGIVRSSIHALYSRHYETGASTKGAWASKELVPYTEVNTNGKLVIQSTWLANYLERTFGFSKATKHVVPKFVMENARTRVGKFYLAGIYYADGGVQGTSKNGYSVRLAQSDHELLLQVQMLLQANGILSNIYLRREAGERSLPDGKGGTKKYSCRADYELVTNTGRIIFRDYIGFLGSEKEAKLAAFPSSTYSQKAYSEVVSVSFLEEREDVFCLSQDETRTLVMNGISAVRCGEIWLGAYDCCCLGSVVLPRFVKDGEFDWDQFDSTVRLAVRFLDNILTVNDFPLPEIKEKCQFNRRIGAGVTGLHTMLLELGLEYDSEEGFEFVDKLFETYKNTAYDESATLASEKGPFPGYSPEFLKGGFAKTLKRGIRNKIRHHGIRNCALMTVAPTGTTTMVCNSISTGIEPLFAGVYWRRWKVSDDKGYDTFQRELVVTDEYKKYGTLVRGAYDISVEAHFRMQATVQKHVDNAVSKTINLPEDYPVEQLSEVWLKYLADCKGTTLYRAGSRGQEPLVLVPIEEAAQVIEEYEKESAEASYEELNAMDCASGVCAV